MEIGRKEKKEMRTQKQTERGVEGEIVAGPNQVVVVTPIGNNIVVSLYWLKAAGFKGNVKIVERFGDSPIALFPIK